MLMPIRPPVFNAGNSHRDYERSRGNSGQQGYTARWNRLAVAYKREHPLCIGCLAVGRVTQVQCVDHVLPHKLDYGRMWDINNLQPLCHWHHNTVKQRLEQMHAQGLVGDGDLRMDSAKAVELTKRIG
jgi:5-methylcytosine-specific restriction enzyme A